MNAESLRKRPLVLVFGGLDPSGAGLQADIETCFSLGCHALPIATANTVQNTAELRRVEAISARFISEQARHLMADLGDIAACKIGLLPTSDVVEVVAEIIRELPNHVPVVLDPVDTASSGGRLVSPEVGVATRAFLLPLTTLIKPNAGEARMLTRSDDLHRAGIDLSLLTRFGALVTGTDEASDDTVHHFLYCRGELHSHYRWPRVRGAFHGTGCTLTSEIAAHMAHGLTLQCAVAAGLCHTWRAVHDAYSIGAVQAIPNRQNPHEIR
jgi:hydroxymethylpyrimidine/phosphomethylpyrimidine kinase